MLDIYRVELKEDNYKPDGRTFFSITLYDEKRIVNDILMEREELRQLYHKLLVEFAVE